MEKLLHAPNEEAYKKVLDKFAVNLPVYTRTIKGGKILIAY